MSAPAVTELFVVAQNPQADSRLPYLVRLPLEQGLVLKARAPWPATTRVYCHRFEDPWPDNADVVDEGSPSSAAVVGRRSISFSTGRGTRAPSSSSPKSKGARRSSGRPRRPPGAANPGGRIPRRRTLAEPVTITVDTRERYPYRFVHQGAGTVRATVAAGDYAIYAPDGRLLAAVERKSLDNFASTLSNGTLAFQLQRLTELPLAAIVVESRYSALFKLEHVNGAWLADQVTRLQVRYPASRSSSPTHAATPKTGPTASSPPRSRT